MKKVGLFVRGTNALGLERFARKHALPMSELAERARGILKRRSRGLIAVWVARYQQIPSPENTVRFIAMGGVVYVLQECPNRDHSQRAVATAYRDNLYEALRRAGRRPEKIDD